MKLLALDTSTAAVTVALLDGDTLLGASSEKADRSHSTRLLPVIQQLITSLGMTINDLDAVAAGCGPGSYTGVRIGVTAAKTFAWSLQIPLIGISSLEALAYGGVNWKDGEKHKTQWIIPIMDARRGQVYTGLYAAGEQYWQCHIMDRILLMEDWIERITRAFQEAELNQQPNQIVVVGEVEAVRERIQSLGDLWPAKVHVVEQDMRAFDLGKLAHQRWMNGDQEEVHRFVPNYTQLAEAEAKLLEKRK